MPKRMVLFLLVTFLSFLVPIILPVSHAVVMGRNCGTLVEFFLTFCRKIPLTHISSALFIIPRQKSHAPTPARKYL